MTADPIPSDAPAETTAVPQLGGGRAWFIWSLAALAFGYAFFQRVAPSVMVSDLMREFGIGGALLGTLSALYFYPYVALQIPLGALIDHYGARLLLTVALATAAIGSLVFGLAESVYAAYLGRVLIGTGSAVGFLGSLALAGKWFPPHRFAFMAGLSMFSGMICGMLGQAPFALFIGAFGWRTGLVALGGFAAALAAMVLVFVRNAPPNGGEIVEKPRSHSHIWRDLLRASASWEVWRIALVAAALAGPMLTLGGLWGTPYLMRAYGLERPEAAFLVSLMLLGWAFGAPLSGWLAVIVGRLKTLLVIGATVLTLSVAPLVVLSDAPLWLTVVLLVLTGASGASMTSGFALVKQRTPDAMHGAATGIVNAMTVASGAVLQPIVGLVLDGVWDGTMAEGSRVYLAADYRTGFAVILATAVLGLILSLTLPSGPLRERD
ncbi:MAG: MFS transporter [Hyphomicrobiales bacterium]|nr:MFS transporter [Hyphomicrobiales bacterium]